MLEMGWRGDLIGVEIVQGGLMRRLIIGDMNPLISKWIVMMMRAIIVLDLHGRFVGHGAVVHCGLEVVLDGLPSMAARSQRASKPGNAGRRAVLQPKEAPRAWRQSCGRDARSWLKCWTGTTDACSMSWQIERTLKMSVVVGGLQTAVGCRGADIGGMQGREYHRHRSDQRLGCCLSCIQKKKNI